MKISDFLKQRREQLGISQADLANRLTSYGQVVSRGTVGHWESERNDAPIEDLQFRRALAFSLEIDLNEMLSILGFVTIEDDRSPNARLAADLIDQMPEDAQEMVLEIIHTIRRRYA